MPIPVLRRLLCAGVLLLPAATSWGETWPERDWSARPIAPSAALSEFETYAFPARDDGTRQGIRTDAVVVIRDGELIYERYAGPTKASTPHLTWSMSKSLLAATLGVAYREGRFKLDEPVAQYYPAFQGHPSVKLGHLLNWASGLAWQEDYEYAPLRSSVVAMLYTRGRGDMARFVAEHQKNPAAELAICGVEKTDETGRLCRLNLAVHGLAGDIRHGGNVNSYYDDPHGAVGQFD